MSKGDWNLFLGIAAMVIAGLAIWGLVISNAPRHRLLIPLIISAVVSGVLFAAIVDGADSFHAAAVLVLVTAIGIGIVAETLFQVGGTFSSVSWALLGTVVPPLLLFGLLFAACGSGGEECFS